MSNNHITTLVKSCDVTNYNNITNELQGIIQIGRVPISDIPSSSDQGVHIHRHNEHQLVYHHSGMVYKLPGKTVPLNIMATLISKSICKYMNPTQQFICESDGSIVGSTYNLVLYDESQSDQAVAQIESEYIEIQKRLIRAGFFWADQLKPHQIVVNKANHVPRVIDVELLFSLRQYQQINTIPHAWFAEMRRMNMPADIIYQLGLERYFSSTVLDNTYNQEIQIREWIQTTN